MKLIAAITSMITWFGKHCLFDDFFILDGWFEREKILLRQHCHHIYYCYHLLCIYKKYKHSIIFKSSSEELKKKKMMEAASTVELKTLSDIKKKMHTMMILECETLHTIIEECILKIQV